LAIILGERKLAMQRDIDLNQLEEDWLGNNIAITCPLCGKVFIVSALVNRGKRECPRCGKSLGVVSGGKDSGGSASVEVEASTMTDAQAGEIASLINDRNKLARNYEAHDILRNACNFEYELREGKVVACVERKKVQWYQWEVCHLSVDKKWEGKGLAFIVYRRAEAAAQTGGARVLQCTIREGNSRSEHFVDRQGYLKVGRFFNAQTENAVGVWQKSLVPPQDRAVS
jgi:RimJ/RimL family protein N-acetyltransferase